jgi:peroxiredoxin
MARIETRQIPLGYKAPAFNLIDTISGNNFTFEQLKGDKGTVVLFICNHCPFVIHVMEELTKIIDEYTAQGVAFILISSNDVNNYPQDGPEQMKAFANQYGLKVPYLYDESQDIAKAYDAVCTPDISIFNDKDECIYRGQMDGSRPGNGIANDGSDLRNVCDHIISGKQIDFIQHPSIGCNIKWK